MSADPSILRIDDTYYATGTSSEWAPYYPVFTSKDLVNWKQTGHVFEQQPEWTKSSFWLRNGIIITVSLCILYRTKEVEQHFLHRSSHLRLSDRQIQRSRTGCRIRNGSDRCFILEDKGDYTSAGKPTDWTTGRSNFSPAS